MFPRGLSILCILAWCVLHVAPASPDPAKAPECFFYDTCANQDPSTRQCQCDDLCEFYGDCCLGFPIRRHTPRYVHLTAGMETSGPWVHAISACLDRYTGPQVLKDLCEVELDFDPFTKVPVTSHISNHTYRNLFCALCHNDYQDIFFWKIFVVFQARFVQAVYTALESDMLDFLRFDESYGGWYFSEGAVTYPVFFVPQFQQEIYVRPFPSRRSFVDSCPATWTNVTVSKMCHEYLSPVYYDNVAYKNIYCAECRIEGDISEIASNLTCRSDQEKLKGHEPVTTYENSNGYPLMRQLCDGSQEVYDPFLKLCRDTRCGVPFFVYANDSCILSPNNPDANTDFEMYVKKTQSSEKISNQTSDSDFQHCPKTMIDPAEYVIDENGLAYIFEMDSYLAETSYKLLSNDSLIKCFEKDGYLEDKFGPITDLLSTIGLIISICCLILHLIVFFAVKEIRNLPGLNLASLSFALLIGYLLFLLKDDIPSHSVPCKVVSVVMYYFFLSSFTWMGAISFNTWKSLYMASTVLKLSNRHNMMRKFAIYSAISWGLPFLIAVPAIVSDFVPFLPVNITPGFGEGICWFSRKYSLLIFFALPNFLIQISNVVFYVMSAIIVVRNRRQMEKFQVSACHRKNFKLFMNLAVIMGLTWVSGSLAGIVDVYFFWVLFTIFTTLQGMFIFICFTCCNKTVRTILMRKVAKKAKVLMERIKQFLERQEAEVLVTRL